MKYHGVPSPFVTSVPSKHSGPLRLLVVHPGASVSTHDVWLGLCAGLKGLGHEVYDYALDGRIEHSQRFLEYCWRRGGKKVERPKVVDVLYHAGERLVARALRVEPDVVLVVSGMFLHPDIFVLMRRAHLRIAWLLTESPYDDERQARLLQWVHCAWTNERTSARKLGLRYLPHAWNADVHIRTGSATADVPSHDVVFVGTGFQERIETLSAVDWSGIDLGLYGAWDLLGSRHPLRKHLRGGYQGNDVSAELYRRAKIGLNLYRTSKGFGKDAPRITDAESLNPRAYELAALGCFTISDNRAEIGEKFGDLVPTFADPAELRPLFDRWLADARGRAQIAAALPAAVSGDTWQARAQTVTEDLESLIEQTQGQAVSA